MGKRFPGLGQNPSNEQIAEALGIFTGERGDKLDRAITFRDLLDKGVIRYKSLRKANLDPERDTEPSNPPPPTIRPPAPTGLAVSGAFQNNLLEWDSPYAQYAGHAYTEIWRHDNDNLANATLAGTSDAAVYADNVGGNRDRYYWIRFVSTSGDAGPYNASSGTIGRTSRSPDDVRDVLTSKGWQAGTFYYDFECVGPRDANGDPYKDGSVALSYQVISAGTTGSSEPTWPTTLGATVTDGGVEWKAVEAGTAPLVIGTLDGNPVVFIAGAVIEEASIEDAKIKALSADKIIANQLSAISANVGDISAGRLASGYDSDGNPSGEVALDLSNGYFRMPADGTVGTKGGVFVDSDGLIEVRNSDGVVVISSAGLASDVVSANNPIPQDGASTFIEDLAVNTLQLRDQAVTFPKSAHTSGTKSIAEGSGWTDAQTLSITPTGAPIHITFSLVAEITTNSDQEITIRVLRDGNIIWGEEWIHFIDLGIAELPTAAIMDQPSGGTSHTYKLQVNPDADTGVDVDVRERTILALELKK